MTSITFPAHLLDIIPTGPHAIPIGRNDLATRFSYFDTNCFLNVENNLLEFSFALAAWGNRITRKMSATALQNGIKG